MSLSNKMNQGMLAKWLILGLDQRIYKIKLEHVVVPETKGLWKRRQI